jgi:hypothetical protein
MPMGPYALPGQLLRRTLPAFGVTVVEYDGPQGQAVHEFPVSASILPEVILVLPPSGRGTLLPSHGAVQAAVQGGTGDTGIHFYGCLTVPFSTHFTCMLLMVDAGLLLYGCCGIP